MSSSSSKLCIFPPRTLTDRFLFSSQLDTLDEKCRTSSERASAGLGKLLRRVAVLEEKIKALEDVEEGREGQTNRLQRVVNNLELSVRGLTDRERIRPFGFN